MHFFLSLYCISLSVLYNDFNVRRHFLGESGDPIFRYVGGWRWARVYIHWQHQNYFSVKMSNAVSRWCAFSLHLSGNHCLPACEISPLCLSWKLSWRPCCFVRLFHKSRETMFACIDYVFVHVNMYVWMVCAGALSFRTAERFALFNTFRTAERGACS